MLSKSEQILEAIKALLMTVPGAKIERNTVVPETIPAGGLIVLRDGDPGEQDTALGGFLQCQVVYELAARQIIDWAGIEDDPPVTHGLSACPGPGFP